MRNRKSHAYIERNRRIYSLFAKGYTNAEIGEEFGLSVAAANQAIRSERNILVDAFVDGTSITDLQNRYDIKLDILTGELRLALVKRQFEIEAGDELERINSLINTIDVYPYPSRSQRRKREQNRLDYTPPVLKEDRKPVRAGQMINHAACLRCLRILECDDMFFFNIPPATDGAWVCRSCTSDALSWLMSSQKPGDMKEG